MSITKRVVASAVTLVLAGAMMTLGLSAAQAATGTSGGCTITSNKPAKSGVYIRATGAGSCNGTASRTLFMELHRSEGFYHPTLATDSNTGLKKNYSVSGQTCDDQQPHKYFNEVRMGDNGYEINSGDTGTLTATC